MLIRADLHLHSPHSGGSGSGFTLADHAALAVRKGIHLLGTGDAHVEGWVRGLPKAGGGLYGIGDIYLLATMEFEDNAGVHHLALFPSTDHATEFAARVARYGHNVMRDGRPRLHLPATEIYDILHDHSAIVGPAHAFTPFHSIYGRFNSIREWLMQWDFVELGLSADARMASRIDEISNSTFVSFSDAHSPSPARLGREYVEMEVDDLSFDGIRRAVERGDVVCYGVPPELGKYHLTACTACGRRYSKEEAEGLGYACDCGGRIARGVKDRVEDLSDRPPSGERYVYNIPLVEVLRASGMEAPLWWEITERMDEHRLLHVAPLEEIRRTFGEELAEAVGIFRRGEYAVSPGGGGRYGVLSFPARLRYPLRNLDNP